MFCIKKFISFFWGALYINDINATLSGIERS